MQRDSAYLAAVTSRLRRGEGQIAGVIGLTSPTGARRDLRVWPAVVRTGTLHRLQSHRGTREAYPPWYRC